MITCLERLTDLLRERNINIEIQWHRLGFTAQEKAAALSEKGRYVAKVFIAMADGEPVMFVLPASETVDLECARALLGAVSLRAARESEFAGLFPDCEVGAMPPFGNLYGLPVYLEASLAARPYLVFTAGYHRAAMKIPMADYVRVVSPIVAGFAHGELLEAVLA
jgi:Ala-tRNA(Pro) deacylase